MDSELEQFIRTQINEQREAILVNVSRISLTKLLVNPYRLGSLISIPQEALIHAFRASVAKSIETTFGKFLENISIEAAKRYYGDENAKTSTNGIDLDIVRGAYRLLISIKSSVSWGNGQSTPQQGKEFKKAIQTIRQNDKKHKIVSIMGICCGNRKTTGRADHADLIISGQNYWHLVSGEKDLYKEIMDILCFGTKEFYERYKICLSQTLTRLMSDFSTKYCFNRDVNVWEDIIKDSCGAVEEDEWVNIFLQKD